MSRQKRTRGKASGLESKLPASPDALPSDVPEGVILDPRSFWTKQAQGLVGKCIIAARYLTPKESLALGWTAGSLVLTLHDGTQLFASQDDEGNGPGCLFVQPSQRAGSQQLPDRFPVIG